MYVLLLSLAPAVGSAAFGGVSAWILQIKFLVDALIVIVAAVAVLVFFWGLVKFIFKAGSDAKTEGKNFMIWGVVALFVMISVWGLVRFIQNELIPNADYSNPTAPKINQ